MQHLLDLAIVGRIAKADMLELNALTKALEDMRAALLANVVLRVHELEDLFARSQRLLKAVVVRAQTLRTGSYSVKTAIRNVTNDPAVIPPV